MSRRPSHSLVSVLAAACLVAMGTVGPVDRRAQREAGERATHWDGDGAPVALCQVARPDQRLARPRSPRDIDGASRLPLASLPITSGRLSRPPLTGRWRAAQRQDDQRAHPVATVRTSRGPPPGATATI